MAMVELAMIAWLIIRGFDDRTHAAAGQSASSLSART
jgi:hypothetical protein